MHLFDAFLRLPKLRLKDTNEKHLKPFNDDNNTEETAEPTEQPIGNVIKKDPGFKVSIFSTAASVVCVKKLFFAGNLDFPKIKKLKTVCSDV